MRMKRVERLMEHRCETVVADLFMNEDDEIHDDALCIVLSADKTYRMLSMCDVLRLDSYQLRWIANRLDEFSQEKAVDV